MENFYTDLDLKKNKIHNAKVVIEDRASIADDDLIDKKFVVDTNNENEKSENKNEPNGYVGLNEDAEIEESLAFPLQAILNKSAKGDKIQLENNIKVANLSWIDGKNTLFRGSYFDTTTKITYLWGFIRTKDEPEVLRKIIAVNEDGSDAGFICPIVDNNSDGNVEDVTVFENKVFVGMTYASNSQPVLMSFNSTGSLINNLSSGFPNVPANDDETLMRISKIEMHNGGLIVAFCPPSNVYEQNTDWQYNNSQISANIVKINPVNGSLIFSFSSNDKFAHIQDFKIVGNFLYAVGRINNTNQVIAKFNVTNGVREDSFASGLQDYLIEDDSMLMSNFALKLDISNNKIAITGVFSPNDLSTQIMLMRLSLDSGLLDTEFQNATESTFQNSSDFVKILPGNKILLVGKFLKTSDSKNWYQIVIDSDGKIDDTFSSGNMNFQNILSNVFFGEKYLILTDGRQSWNDYYQVDNGILQLNRLTGLKTMDSDLEYKDGSLTYTFNHFQTAAEFTLMNKKMVREYLRTLDIDISQISNHYRNFVPDYIYTIDPMQAEWENGWLALQLPAAINQSGRFFDNCIAKIKTPSGWVFTECQIIAELEPSISITRVLVKDVDKRWISPFGLFEKMIIWFNINYAESFGQRNNFSLTQKRGGNVLLSDQDAGHADYMMTILNEYYVGTKSIINTYAMGETNGLMTSNKWKKYAQELDADLVLQASTFSALSATNASPEVLVVVPNGQNSHVRLDATSGPEVFFPCAIIVSAGNDTVQNWQDNWDTSFGYGVEFFENTEVLLGDEMSQQSPATALVAIKLKNIKDATNVSWPIVRKAARITASNSNVWDMYRGFGIIDVNLAIEYIKTQVIGFSKNEAKDYADIHSISKVVRISDMDEDTPMPRRAIPFTANGGKSLQLSFYEENTFLLATEVFNNFEETFTYSKIGNKMIITCNQPLFQFDINCFVLTSHGLGYTVTSPTTIEVDLPASQVTYSLFLSYRIEETNLS